MKHYLLLFSLLGVLIVGCKSPTSPGSGAEIETLFPLAYGNYWIYDAKVFNPDGSVQGESTQTNEVLGTQTIQGHPAFTTDFDGSQEFLFFSGNDLMSTPSDSSVPQIIIRYPMNMGQTITTVDTTIHFSFDTTFSESLRQKQTLTFSSIEQVTVPAGTFPCYHFEILSIINYSVFGSGFNDTGRVHLFLSPGVGLVKELVFQNDSGRVTMQNSEELTSYRVK